MMDTYYITATKKSRGNITELHGIVGKVATTAEAIDNIESGKAKYMAVFPVEILVKTTAQGGKYLTTSPDGIAENNLDKMEDPLPKVKPKDIEESLNEGA